MLICKTMSMKLRHILIPSDLSPDSLRPCSELKKLVSEVGKITLLHVVEDLKAIPHGSPFAPLQSSPELSEDIAHARKKMEEQRTALPEDFDVTIEVIAAEKLAKGVADYAKHHDVDMIALSTHGRTGFRHLALGSVAEAILRHSTTPVLCFPRK